MKNYFKKIIISCVGLGLILSISGIPEKAYAQLAVAEVNSTPSLFQQIANAASNLGTSFSTYSLQFKAFVLDTLATSLAKQLIRKVTADVVQWINSGFEGSPSFLTNPGSFFLDVADQVTGEFLAGAGGPLTSLCSEFSIDIRLALAFKYHPKVYEKYRCTLGTIIKNTASAVNGATINGRSINGFMAGDFSQGGWPAFVSLTTSPQNNQYGAYLEADSELSVRVANAKIAKKDEINNGKGFLSWRNPKCTAKIKEENKAAAKAYANTSEEDYYANGGDANAKLVQKSTDSCPIETPGSLIGDVTTAHIVGPLTELELVDSINQIVNALAAQLVNTVLQGGLQAITGTGPSDSTAYINQIQAEANSGNTTQFTTVRNDFIKSVETYITSTLQFKINKDQSLNLILDAKNSYEGVRGCYTNKITNPQPALTSSQLYLAQSKIAEIDSTIQTNVAPLVNQLLDQTKDASTRYTTLTNLRDKANAATTVNDINGPSQEFSRMLQNQTLTTPKDIVESQQQLAGIQATTQSMKTDTVRKMQECQAFPYGSSYGSQYNP